MREKKGKILLICLMFFVFLDLGWANSGQEAPSIKKSNLIALIQEPMQKLLTQAYETIYSNMQNILHNGVAYTIILIIIIYWLILRLKTGYPTRDEIFEALKWLVMVFFVFGIFTSFNAYTGFLSLIYLPANWVRSAVSTLFDINQYGGDFESVVNKAFSLQNKLVVDFVKICNDKSDFGLWGNIIPGGKIGEQIYFVLCLFSLFFYWLYYLVFAIAMLGGICIYTGSSFIAMLLLSTAPIVIPFLIIKPLKPYFYSWLKLVISYSLYPSIALIILSLAMKPLNELEKIVNQQKAIEELYNNTFIAFFPMTLMTIIVIFLLTKIPNWVSQIMGVQGLDSGGVGAGLSLAKQAGVSMASAGVGGLAGGLAARAAGGNILGGVLGGAGRATLSSIPGNKTMRQLMDSAKKTKTSNEYGEATP
ncbi:type IV secretion system protein [Campylobacter cuniculorum]|uniref:Type IV secretion system protein VirB6 n=2 Tax=Campylobacter cuniculorum TaxID=374106 RepID=A0A1W6BYF9_9BACT|nr:type IV secretion system protein [Campylobacter cuniculorum]ARJ57131.1 type IV secretion system protein VirB6 [Campylobacter cuniculorum DSM 23162 = LMG 24588]QOR04574.1 type IV secretion system protein [Campylobacter cuniculorum]